TFSGVAIHVADVGRSIPATRDTFNLTNRFDGVGPSVFAELKRPFCCSGLALVANVRASEVFGSPTVRAMQVNGIGKEPITQTWDLAPQTSALSLTELQLGAEWARDLGRSSLFAQALWEAQYWINTGNTLVPLADNLSLVGVTFRVGLKH
ncbi:MAG: Lpg1974 family pore-forming outer membrane protein, partial [Thermoguttaceae bacterium]